MNSSLRLLGENRAVRQRTAGMIATIACLHIVGWTTLIALVAPLHLSLDSKAFGIGIGVTAYLFGMRHAFDADHIAAIDNITRKLIGTGTPAASVGFWFSVGHSTVVFVAIFILTFGITGVGLFQANSGLRDMTGTFGTIVSGGFLYVIAAINLVVLIDIWKTFRRMQGGSCGETALETKLQNRGAINRLLKPAMWLVGKPWHMFVVGLLFGLGFDTATEVALLVMSGSGASAGLPWYAILCLPILFAAGMSLCDTLDGCLMSAAYGWAFVRPARMIYYNLTITGLSVVVALLIGTVELLALLGEKAGRDGRLFNFIGSIDLNTAGFVVVGLFVVVGAIAAAFWKLETARGRRLLKAAE